MIFNLSQGGVAYISVTAPSGSSITASYSGITLTRTGSGTIQVPAIGTWTVKCVYDGITKTNNVSVTSYGQTFSTTFTYSATITINCPAGSSIVASMSGQSNVTRTGAGSITVYKIGTWSVKCTYDGKEYTNSVTVSAYDTNYNTSFTYEATINVTCPVGSSVVASMSGQSNVTRTGSGSLKVPKTGTWTVTCTYDGSTKSNSVSVSAYGGSYSTSFTYTCTIQVNCPANASVVASMSGQNSVSRTGSGTLTVPKKGNWTVTASIGSGSGYQTKSATATAAYGSSVTVSVYPKFYIYLCNKGNGAYYGAGLTLFDADNKGSSVDYNHLYGDWRIVDYCCSDSGNNVLITDYSVNLTGYTTMKIHCKLIYANRIELGLTTANNMYNSDNWAYRNRIHQLSQPDNRVSVDWTTYSISISSTESVHPVLINLGGGYIPSLAADYDSEVQIQEWWLE